MIFRSIPLVILFALVACASRARVQSPSGDAKALLASSAALQSVAIVDIETRDTLYLFSPVEVDSLKSSLKSSFVSEGLLMTPAPWPVALVLEAGKGAFGRRNQGPTFVALYYGDVLRVNSRNPWSTIIADSSGNVPASGIADIVFDADDVSWIFDLVQKTVKVPPSKSHRVPDMPRILDVD